MQYAIAHEVGSAALNAIPFGAATKTALVLAGPQKPPPAFIWTASRVQTFLNYMLHDQEYAGLLKGGIKPEIKMFNVVWAKLNAKYSWPEINTESAVAKKKIR